MNSAQKQVKRKFHFKEIRSQKSLAMKINPHTLRRIQTFFFSLFVSTTPKLHLVSGKNNEKAPTLVTVLLSVVGTMKASGLVAQKTIPNWPRQRIKATEFARLKLKGCLLLTGVWTMKIPGSVFQRHSSGAV